MPPNYRFKLPRCRPEGIAIDNVVKQLIIWGDEHSNSTKEAALAQWLKSNAAAFKT
eukprot:COSAG02_NODE_3739_length_6303_cov_12.797228_1_plen_55_part_10